MNLLRTGIFSVMLFVGCAAFFHAVDADSEKAGTLSVMSDSKGWACRNLEEDWNYLFHPRRVNQCRPRGFESNAALEKLSRQAFLRDDPLIPRYCGSPFSSP